MLFTVLVATYNRRHLLEKCLNSILAQTYKNIEIVISDDNSNDDTQDFMLDLCKKEPRIRYYRNETNLGPVANSKKMLDYISGEYALYLCDDDYFVDADFISICAKKIYNNPKIGLIMGESEIDDQINNVKIQASLKGSYGVFDGLKYLLTHNYIYVNFNATFFETNMLRRLYRQVEDTNWESGFEILLLAYYESIVCHIEVLASVWVNHKGGTGNYIALSNPRMFIRAIDAYWKLYLLFRENNSLKKYEIEHLKWYYLDAPLKELCNAPIKSGIISKKEIAGYFSERSIELGDYVLNFLKQAGQSGFDMTKEFIIYGAGLAGKEAYEVLKKTNLAVDCFLDDNLAGDVYEGIAINSLANIKSLDRNVLIAIGDKKIAEKVECNLKSLGFSHIVLFSDFYFNLLVD